jgi:hypothetical protein
MILEQVHFYLVIEYESNGGLKSREKIAFVGGGGLAL